MNTPGSSWFSPHECTVEHQTLNYRVYLNQNDIVYQGHFPDQPVTPGVCLLLMIRKLLEQHLEQHLQFQEGRQLKFMRMVNPVLTPELVCDLSYQKEYNSYPVSATLSDPEGIIYCKIKGTFQPLL